MQFAFGVRAYFSKEYVYVNLARGGYCACAYLACAWNWRVHFQPFQKKHERILSRFQALYFCGFDCQLVFDANRAVCCPAKFGGDKCERVYETCPQRQICQHFGYGRP